MERERVIEQVLGASHRASVELLRRIYDRTRDNDPEYLLELCTATLCCVRKSMPASAYAEVAQALPLPLRGMFFAGWSPGEPRVQFTDVEHFVRCVQPHVACYAAEQVLEEDVIAAAWSFFETFDSIAEIARAYLPPELYTAADVYTE